MRRRYRALKSETLAMPLSADSCGIDGECHHTLDTEAVSPIQNDVKSAVILHPNLCAPCAGDH